MLPRAFSLLLIAGALAWVSTSARAATVSSTSPSAVFRPIPGGYVLQQPPGPNLSNVPQELNPSAGQKGRGAFGGGQVFRANANGSIGPKTFEMGGIYDMPVSTADKSLPAKKVPVTAVSKGIPKAKIAKAIAKSLPFVGTAIALYQFKDELATAWDSIDPQGSSDNGPAFVDPETGQVMRKKITEGWGPDSSNPIASSPSAACSILHAQSGITWPSAGIEWIDASHSNAKCMYSVPGYPNQTAGTVSKSAPAPFIQLPTPEHVEQASPMISDSAVEQAFETAKQHPDFSVDVPEGLPTEVTGPSSIPNTSKTTTKPDGSSTTTTTTTTITYNGDTINITNLTKVTNTAPDGTVTEGETTEEQVTPEEPTEEEQVTPPADPDMPTVPDFYQQKYPDGLAGVWDARTSAIKSTPLFSLVDALPPASLGSGGGCPTFMLPVNLGRWNFGTFDISPPCVVWDFGRVFLMLGALLLARALIFGG